MFSIRSSRVLRAAAAVAVSGASLFSLAAMGPARAAVVPTGIAGYWLDTAGGLHGFAAGRHGRVHARVRTRRVQGCGQRLQVRLRGQRVQR